MNRLTLIAFVWMPLASGAAEPGTKPIDYSRDIKPLLSSRCYTCHGPDKGQRKAGLRLDERASALKNAIKPGNAADSALIERVTSDDADLFMPPSDSKKEKLTPPQIELLKRWISEGAKFDQHWAYIKPVRPAVPADKDKPWAKNEIDAFIAAGQERQGYSHNAEADRITLIRRLSFDLTGLPPTPAEVDAFVSDRGPDAFDKVVDRLLSSKHFGERMALYWLDLVRFADTGGYHSDNHRDITLYRDYVIEAFNQNKRFDQFTIEQLAGDLLPNPTIEQRIASGYNRLLMTTEEGGAQPKEYMAKYSADRVRNFSGVWLAGTMGCCECHNHKYDPYTTKDFYSLASFFADIKEKAVGRQDQDMLPGPDQAQQLRKVDDQITALQKVMNTPTLALLVLQLKWEAETRKAGNKGVPRNIADILAVDASKRTDKQKQALTSHYRSIAPQLEKPRKELAELTQKREALVKAIPTTLVSMSVAPRVMHILPRGNWLDDSGEVVAPAVPGFLSPLDTREKRANRLDLARWVVSPDNPLTARVFVNRLWKLLFGQGLVKSVDDFGAQGELPSHPELLDWLAVEFVESGWNVKHMLTLMLQSSTYRQSSVPTREQRERDPANRWLARQGRFRLDAEMVHDNALAIAGLLSDQVGGASVKPYQPEGYWQYLNFPTRTWVHDHGASLYRRGMYTYWQRTLLHPSLLAFDAPSREECTADRPRSSTPLQALVLLNDPIYVEAARVFAERIIKQGGATPTDRFHWAYRRALSRAASPEELSVLLALYEKHATEFKADKQAAQKLIATGEAPASKDMDVVELAAWTSVARVILNLHETITRN
jgi:hypothetical protein